MSCVCAPPPPSLTSVNVPYGYPTGSFVFSGLEDVYLTERKRNIHRYL